MIDNGRIFFQNYGEDYLQPGTGGFIPGGGWGANFTPQPQQGGGFGYQPFNIPSGQQYGQQQPGSYGYSPTAQGIKNYMGQQVPQQYQPQGLPQMAPGAMDPQQAGYQMQGGLAQQRYGMSQSGVAQGIQNLMGLTQSQGIPTGMAGARTVADIASGSASADQKQRTQDALSALQGQRGTGAGLGSNVDTMMGQALGIDASAARSTYANALVSYLQNQLQMLTAGSRALAPTA